MSCKICDSSGRVIDATGRYHVCQCETIKMLELFLQGIPKFQVPSVINVETISCLPLETSYFQFTPILPIAIRKTLAAYYLDNLEKTPTYFYGFLNDFHTLILKQRTANVQFKEPLSDLVILDLHASIPSNPKVLQFQIESVIEFLTTTLSLGKIVWIIAAPTPQLFRNIFSKIDAALEGFGYSVLSSKPSVLYTGVEPIVKNPNEPVSKDEPVPEEKQLDREGLSALFPTQKPQYKKEYKKDFNRSGIPGIPSEHKDLY